MVMPAALELPVGEAAPLDPEPDPLAAELPLPEGWGAERVELTTAEVAGMEELSAPFATVMYVPCA